MKSDRFKIIKAILADALALPEAEREAFIGKAAPDEALASEVLTLMRYDDEQAAMAAADVPDSEADLGREIDGFKLLRILGEGGMGIVYLAEQTKPIRRRVALKIIKIGMDTREVIGRFEVERQALALMDHPNIARVIEAGATPKGRPYFVMEYIPGQPITEYCRDHEVSLEERLRLFVQVCRAVHHAHRRGIIHRDLKPGNVLVTGEGEEPTAKVIDFGVAKATEQRLTENTVCTRLGMMIGTPEYMSPEQAVLEQADIDNRCDVYSLGVILYELLTGRLPIDRKTLIEAGWARIQDLLREFEPQQPSTRIGVAATKPIDAEDTPRVPRQWSRRIRGDLDWVTMRALEKNRERRYESSAALANEIERFLKNEPVDAGPPSKRYRLSKLVRRHRVAVTVGLIVLFSLLIGITGTTMGLLRANRAEGLARAAARASDAGRLCEVARNTDLPSHSLAIMSEALHLDDRPEYRLEVEELLLAEAPMHRLPKAPNSRNPGALDISPDGKWLAVAWSRNGSLQLFSMTGGDPVALVGHAQRILAAKFLPDGSGLVSAAVDSTVRVWSLPLGDAIRTWKFDGIPLVYLNRGGFPLTILEGRSHEPWRMYTCDSASAEPVFGGEFGMPNDVILHTSIPAVDPLGLHMVTMRDSFVVLYDLKSPGASPARILGSHPGKINGASFAPNGQEVLTYDSDGLIRIWSPTNERSVPLREIQSGDKPTWTRYSNDGRWISASAATGQYLWDLDLPPEALPRILRGSEHWSFGSAFHPTLPWVVSLHTSSTVAAWSLAGPRRIDLALPEGDSAEIGFSPDGKLLVAATDAGEVLAWPLDGERIGEGRLLARFPNHSFSEVVFDDAGRFCYLSICNSPEGTGTLTRVPLHGGEPRIWQGGTCTWRLDATGRLGAFSASESLGVPRARILDLETEDWIDLQDSGGTSAHAIGFARDGRLVAGGANGLGLWSRDGREFERLIDLPKTAILASDRKTLVVCDQSDRWYRGTVDDPASMVPVPGARNSDYYFYAVDTRAERVALGSQAGGIEVLDFETEERYLIPLYRETIVSPAFDPKGRWLAAGESGVVTLLPLPSGSSRLDWDNERYLEWLDSLSNLRIETDSTMTNGYRVTGRSVPDWDNPPRW